MEVGSVGVVGWARKVLGANTSKFCREERCLFSGFFTFLMKSVSVRKYLKNPFSAERVQGIR